MITSKKYIVDNKEFRVYIDEKDYIIIKHFSNDFSKKYSCEFTEKNANLVMIDKDNKSIYNRLF